LWELTAVYGQSDPEMRFFRTITYHFFSPSQ